MIPRLIRHSSGWCVFGVSLACALALGASPASAVTIDFESLTHVDDAVTGHGNSYSEDGFTLSQPGVQPFELSTFGTLEDRFSGSTALFNNTDSGVTELALTGGGSFSLGFIDLVELNDGGGGASVTFTGDLTVGGTVTNTFTLDGVAFVAQTFPFSGFDSVTKVSWSQDYQYHQFDNIVINAPNAVPEPASLGLLGLGLAALAWTRRRTRS